MKCIVFKDTPEIRRICSYKPGMVYIWGELQAFILLQEIRDKDPDLILEKHIIIKPLEKVLDKAMDCFDMRDKSILLIRGGGIGDIIALSSLVSYLQDKHNPKEIILLTDPQYNQVTAWYPDPVKIWDAMEPLFEYKKLFSFKNNNYRIISTEGMIERSSQNWIQIFFSIIGQERLNNEYYRPELLQYRISDKPSNIYPGRRSITLVCRSSSVLRSIPFAEIWFALRDLLQDQIRNFDIYCHIPNTSSQDRDYMLSLYKLGYDNLKLVNCETISDYLLDLFDTDLVITVDTSAIHFREGIHKQAIGLFNCIGSEARSKFYEYTTSYDISSPCTLQPCYPGSIVGSFICKTGQEAGVVNYAPCLSPEYNTTLKKQLSNIFNNNKHLFTF